MEVSQYPPAAGPLAIYTKDEFNQYLEFAIKNVSVSNRISQFSKEDNYLFFKYALLESSSVGAFFRTRNAHEAWVSYCQTEYAASKFDPVSNDYQFDSHTKQGKVSYKCIN